jgi:hypothetical protein
MPGQGYFWHLDWHGRKNGVIECPTRPVKNLRGMIHLWEFEAKTR